MLQRYLPEISVAGVILAIALFLGLFFQVSFAGTDLAQTVSVARNIANGDGLSTDLMYYEVHYQLGTPPVPQTVFPPGYPILLALPALAKADLIQWSFIFSLASWVVTVVLLGGAVRLLTADRVLSAVAAIIWSLITVNWAIVLEAYSETVYVASATACLYFLARWEASDARAMMPLLLAAATAGFTFLIRYQGVFLVAAVTFIFFLRVVEAPRKKAAVRDFVAVSAISVAPVVILFVRNALLTGHFGGGPIASVNHASGIGQVLVATYHDLSRIMGISFSGLRDAGVAEILFLFAVACGIVVAMRGGVRRVVLAELLRSPTARVALTYIGVTLAALGYLALTKSLNYIQTRYLATLIPPLIILAFMTFNLSRNRKNEAGSGRKVVYSILALAFLSGQYSAGKEQLESVAAGWGYAEIERALTSEVTGRPAREFLREAIDRCEFVLASQSQVTGLVLERGVYGLPPAAMSDREFGEREVFALVAEHNIEYILVYPQLFDASAPNNRNRLIFSQLLSSEPPVWLEPLLLTNEVRLFRVSTEHKYSTSPTGDSWHPGARRCL